MSILTGVIHEGRVELDAPAPLPNGTRVHVKPDPSEADDWDQEPWPTTPDGIEAMLRELAAIEPAVLTPEEEADFAAWRRAMKDRDIEKMRLRTGSNP